MSEGVAGSPLGATPSAAAPGSLLRPAPAIPDHELLHPIGRGAYGEVWLARNVVGTFRAVKVLYRQDFGDAHPFDREFHGIQKFEPISRSHPGVVNILQIGRNDAEGYFYYVMELADEAREAGIRSQASGVKPEAGIRNQGSGVKPGEGSDSATLAFSLQPLAFPHYTPRTLRQELKARGHLPFDECVELGLTLTSALEHLHGNGLVHRDVKPSNIIFVKGQPKLADIGLVAGVDEARSFVGTEGFIPPEGPGKPQADIYSLGKVLYEAAMGRSRVDFPSLPKDWDAMPADEQSRLAEFNEVLVKACEGDPGRRYRSAGEMHRDLERLQRGRSIRRQRTLEAALWWAKRVFPLALLLLLVGVAATALTRQLKTSALPVEKASVFVVPFRSPPGDSASAELAGRVTDALIDSIGVLLGPGRVGPRKSAWAWLNEDEVRRRAFREFRAKSVLTGHLAVTNAEVEVKLSLFERAERAPVWTERVVGSTNQLVVLEHALLASFRGHVGLKGTSSDVELAAQQILTNNCAALELCRQGWKEISKGTVAAFGPAKVAFRGALDLDPKCLDAWLGLVVVDRYWMQERRSDEGWPSVMDGARQALRTDDTHWSARLWLACGKMLYDWQWEEGCLEVEQLLRDNPNFAHKALYQALCCRWMGRMEAAREFQTRFDALDLKNEDWWWHGNAALLVERRYEEAIQRARKWVKQDPKHPEGFIQLGYACAEHGDYTEALEAIQQGSDIENKQELVALRGYVFARMGRTNDTWTVLADLDVLSTRGVYVHPTFIARVYAALDNSNEALRWLEKACEDRSEYLVNTDMGGGNLRVNPAWDKLQTNPRFKELLRKTGLDKWPK
jgi:tetratricopeptide (TPR) repeat protein